MRICFTFFVTPIWLGRRFERKVHRQNCAASGRGMNLELSTQTRYTLLNAKQSQALGLPDFKALAIILNRKRQMAGFLLDAHAYRGGAGVARAVMQRLLDHAVDAGFVLVR